MLNFSVSVPLPSMMTSSPAEAEVAVVAVEAAVAEVTVVAEVASVVPTDLSVVPTDPHREEEATARVARLLLTTTTSPLFEEVGSTA